MAFFGSMAPAFVAMNNSINTMRGRVGRIWPFTKKIEPVKEPKLDLDLKEYIVGKHQSFCSYSGDDWWKILKIERNEYNLEVGDLFKKREYYPTKLEEDKDIYIIQYLYPDAIKKAKKNG